jgi:type IV pilus assembly protein PilM
VRQLSLPNMSAKQRRQTIEWEARNYISFPMEDGSIESQIIGQSSGKDGQNMMDVMLVAAPRDMVDACAETMQLAGLEPLAVEMQAFAAMRTLVGLSSVDPQATVALVGIGATFSEITIVQGERFILSRIIPIAGNNLTEAIRSSLEVNWEEAELLKGGNLRIVLSEEERANLEPAAQQASRAIEPLLDELIREIRRSLAYHDYQQKLPEAGAQGQGADQILLSGGSAKLAGIDRYLQSQLSIPTAVVDIFGPEGLDAGMENTVFLKEHAPTLVNAVGLALREAPSWRAKGQRSVRSARANEELPRQEAAVR